MATSSLKTLSSSSSPSSAAPKFLSQQTRFHIETPRLEQDVFVMNPRNGIVFIHRFSPADELRVDDDDPEAAQGDEHRLPIREAAASASALRGFIVIDGGATFCTVSVDGTDVQGDSLGEFGGFRDVPPGEHTVVIRTTWSGPPLVATFALKPGGVAVYKIDDDELVEETDVDAFNAVARAAVVGTMRSSLLPYPAAPAAECPLRRSGKHVRIEEPRTPRQSTPPKTPKSAAGHRQPAAEDTDSLEALFDDIRSDPSSATLKDYYRDLVQSQLLRGDRNTELGKAIVRHLMILPKLRAALCTDPAIITFTALLKGSEEDSVSCIGDQLERLLVEEC
eukprot:m51a1_g8426 hypothetical protein (336) ;mRNA; r:335574-337100